MDTLASQNWIKTEIDRADRIHPPIATTTQALDLFTDQLALVRAARKGDDDPGKNADFARRSLQIAGACIRVVRDLNLNPNHPGSIPSTDHSPSAN